MKKDASHLEPFRVKEGEAATTSVDGCSGNFKFKIKDALIQVSSEEDVNSWNHIIVVAFDKPQSSIISRLTSTKEPDPRSPTNEEIMHVKRLFFDDDERCIEYVPAKGDKTPWHHIARHVWCRTYSEFPVPVKTEVEAN